MLNKTNEYFDNLNLGAEIKNQTLANDLRKRSTGAEQILWEQLRNRKVEGVKFRRQHAIRQFIADFYCHEVKLIIEVDGEIHNIETMKERDEVRTFELQKYGISIIRFTNEEIFYDMNKVMEKIRAKLKERNHGI